MSSQHNQLAAQLGKLYRERKQKSLAMAHCDEDMEARELAMTPAEGWSGKNEEARKAARAIAMSSDDTCKAIRAVKVKLRDELADLDGLVDELESQRRGLEWTVRERLAQAMAGRREAPGPVEDAAFDDAPLDAVVEQALPTPLEAGETDALPF